MKHQPNMGHADCTVGNSATKNGAKSPCIPTMGGGFAHLGDVVSGGIRTLARNLHRKHSTAAPIRKFAFTERYDERKKMM